MQMPPDRLRLTQELHALLVEYWHDVDTNWGRNAPEYYTDDGVFELATNSHRGREQIRAFYQFRVSRGARIAVHSVSNFRVEITGPEEATCTWYLFLYAADGTPVLPTHPPIQIAFMTDRMVRDGDGGWLVGHRKFQPWFEGGTPITDPAPRRSGPVQRAAAPDR